MFFYKTSSSRTGTRRIVKMYVCMMHNYESDQTFKRVRKEIEVSITIPRDDLFSALLLHPRLD